jgi:hypothetical protein
VEVVIHGRKTSDGDGEDGFKLFQAIVDPGLSVMDFIRQEECLSDASTDAVVPASGLEIDDSRASDGHSMPLNFGRKCQHFLA